MKFLCDVHISFKIVRHLRGLGFESIHVNDILEKWFPKDKDICNYADTNNMIVITKDTDFRDSFFIRKTPKKLLKINLGNISNQELMNIISVNLNAIQKLNLNSSFLVEIDKDFTTFLKPDN